MGQKVTLIQFWHLLFRKTHWRHIIGQYSSNRAALVDLMSNSRLDIDFFRCLFVSPAHGTGIEVVSDLPREIYSDLTMVSRAIVCFGLLWVPPEAGSRIGVHSRSGHVRVLTIHGYQTLSTGLLFRKKHPETYVISKNWIRCVIRNFVYH